ncbi:MAG: hypothetical protein LC659_15535 [Myxococcales bacterium]|nr:hypothetical protein [Myxococcales bacterium]
MASTTIGGASVTTAHYARFSASLVSGFVASLAGGVVMAVVMVVAYMTMQHTSLMYALRPIGTFLYGDRMLVAPTAGMYAAATAFHFAVCAIWGIVFAFAATLLRADKSFGGSLVLGIVIGLASQIIDVNLVTPALQNSLWGQDLWTATVPPPYSWLGHVGFGLAFVLAPLMFRKLWVRWSGRGDVLYDDARIR